MNDPIMLVRKGGSTSIHIDMCIDENGDPLVIAKLREFMESKQIPCSFY